MSLGLHLNNYLDDRQKYGHFKINFLKKSLLVLTLVAVNFQLLWPQITLASLLQVTPNVAIDWPVEFNQVFKPWFDHLRGNRYQAGSFPVDLGDRQAVRIRWVDVSAYSSTVDQTDSTPWNTATGAWVRDGMVATNFLPFGTRVKFPQLFDDKIFVVQDRMNKRYTDRFDLWMTTRQKARNFGVRRVKVEIYQAR